MFHDCIYLQQSKCTKMISPRVFLFATLTLAAIDNAQASLNNNAPVTFNYKYEDNLDVNIFLRCVPENASTFVLYYETENCQVQPERCKGIAKNDTIPENKTITTTELLCKQSITIYIELYTQSKEKLTNQTMIMAGTRDKGADNNTFREDCLNKQNQNNSKCQIIVNFGNQCAERTFYPINCTQEKELLICKVGDEELPEDTVHQWYQVYANGSHIEPIPLSKGKKTEFRMKLHKFDNNTNIYNKMNWTRSQKNFYSQVFKVSLLKDGFKTYDIQDTKEYEENETINFSCSNHTNTQVGWINQSGDHIILNNMTSYNGTFSKKGNNGMFCCISYNIDNLQNKTVVERLVSNITRIKIKQVNQNNVKGGTERTTLSTLPPVSKTTSTSHSQLSTHLSTSAEQGNMNPISLPWIITAGIAGTILLVAIIYIVIKKWCQKSSNPDQTLQMETYGSTNMVLYAELDIRPGPAQPPPTVEDPTYAQIIGVLRPKNDQVNK